jgi:hypothetical protein
MLQFEKTRLNGVPLMVVAKNLGHTDTRMVERSFSSSVSRKWLATISAFGVQCYDLVE